MVTTTQQDLMQRYQRVMFPATSPYFADMPIVVDHAKDQYIYDTDGQQYLDFFGGVLTVSVGHCNDTVTAKTIEQLQKAQHTSTLYVNEIMVQVAEKVAALTPGRLQMCYFTNSGSEANETAIMAARMYTGNTDVIALRHAYSGRTMTAMSVTAHGTWRLGGVFDGSIKHVRNPYTYRAPVGLSADDLVELCVQDLEEVIATTTNGHIAAFMAEPIQGVGGFIVPPRDYFQRIEPIIREAGGVFIADEVQTAWGRTGQKWFGIEHFGIEPDIMTFAKGMANGSPIGCTIATPEIAEAVQGLTFSTFGGNPVTMATALATIEYIEDNNLLENARVRGAQLRQHLGQLQAQHDFIGDVRGMGLMQALEIIDPASGDPASDTTVAIMEAARAEGLLIGKGGLYGNVLRIAPHLNVTESDIEDGAARLRRACAAVSG
jgi:4-aminobutyrate aminotransferase-like enzyme